MTFNEIYKFFEKEYVKHLDKQVEKYWNIYHFDMEPNHQSYNNEGDAFKHCYMSCEFALWFGQLIAKKIGDKREKDNPYNTEAEMRMDLHNNSIGREIAKDIKKKYVFWFLRIDVDDIIAERVMDKMRNGYLITKPE